MGRGARQDGSSRLEVRRPDERGSSVEEQLTERLERGLGSSDHALDHALEALVVEAGRLCRVAHRGDLRLEEAGIGRVTDEPPDEVDVEGARDRLGEEQPVRGARVLAERAVSERVPRAVGELIGGEVLVDENFDRVTWIPEGEVEEQRRLVALEGAAGLRHQEACARLRHGVFQLAVETDVTKRRLVVEGELGERQRTEERHLGTVAHPVDTCHFNARMRNPAAMKARLLTGLFGTWICGAAFVGCKSDAPPPAPTPEASSTAAAAASGKPDALVHHLPAFSDATNKRFRIELCFYGAYGLRLTRDAYLASLGGKEPAEGKLPTFGDFPTLDDPTGAPTASPSAASSATPAGPKAEPRLAPKAAPTASASAAAAGTASSGAAVTATRPTLNVPGLERLPFTRYVSSCTLATRKEGKNSSEEPIDKAITEFDAWASNVNRLVMGAQRYYSAKQYDGDKFERGRSLHKELTESFAALDEKFAALTQAFLAWEVTLGKPEEKLDKGAEAGFEALQTARVLAAALLADKPDAEALAKAVEAVVKAREALEAVGKDDPKTPYPRELGARLGKLVVAAGKAKDALADRRASIGATFLVLNEVAGLVEAHHRALGQHLRASGQTRPGSPITTLRPRMESLGGRPDARTVRPRPGKEEHPE